MTTEEMLLQLIEGQKQMTERLDKMDIRLDKMDKRFDKIENDLDEIKEKCDIAYSTADHNGEVLEKLTDQLTALNIVDVKY